MLKYKDCACSKDCVGTNYKECVGITCGGTTCGGMSCGSTTCGGTKIVLADMDVQRNTIAGVYNIKLKWNMLYNTGNIRNTQYLEYNNH